MANRRRTILAAILLLRPAGGMLAQCAMCGEAAGSGEVGRGLSISVLFLLAALFLTVGWLVVLAVRSHPSPPSVPPGGARPIPPRGR